MNLASIEEHKSGNKLTNLQVNNTETKSVMINFIRDVRQGLKLQTNFADVWNRSPYGKNLEAISL